MDFTSPNAFWALAITVFASCAIAFPHRYATQNATTASLFNTAPPFTTKQNIPFMELRRNSKNATDTPILDSPQHNVASVEKQESEA
jgi:hypothetical protein